MTPAITVEHSRDRMSIKRDGQEFFFGPVEHVFEDGLDWWEIFPLGAVFDIVDALTSLGFEILEREAPDWSVGIYSGFIAFLFPHEEPDGTCPFMIENRTVRLSGQQVESLKVGIREAAGVNLNTGMLARRFAQIAAETEAE